MAGLGKKGPVFVPRDAARLLDQLSKAALMDMVWNLSLLGTNETHDEVLAKAAREAVLVARERGDAVPAGLVEAAHRVIDSDADGDDLCTDPKCPRCKGRR